MSSPPSRVEATAAVSDLTSAANEPMASISLMPMSLTKCSGSLRRVSGSTRDDGPIGAVRGPGKAVVAAGEDANAATMHLAKTGDGDLELARVTDRGGLRHQCSRETRVYLLLRVAKPLGVVKRANEPVAGARSARDLDLRNVHGRSDPDAAFLDLEHVHSRIADERGVIDLQEVSASASRLTRTMSTPYWRHWTERVEHTRPSSIAYRSRRRSERASRREPQVCAPRRRRQHDRVSRPRAPWH